MENTTLDDNLNSELVLDGQIRTFLMETAKWARFLAIVGFVVMGIMVLVGIFMGSVMSAMGPGFGELATGGISTGIMSTIYIVLALIYMMPLLYMYRFATRMKLALEHESQAELSTAFENLKSCYKFIGILTAIIVGIYALIFVLTLVMGIAR